MPCGRCSPLPVRGRRTGHPTVGDGGFVALPGESAHRFDALALFLLLGLGTGLLIGAGGWLLRSVRGPAQLLAMVTGSALGGALAMGIGTLLGSLRYRVPAAGLDPALAQALNPAPATIVTEAIVARPPPLESPWVLVVQPFAVALAFALAAGWNGRDDLGRGVGHG